MLDGLACIHKEGYFHRDMKPENILVTNKNVVKIADFGLAKMSRSAPPFTDYVSTRWYRAPELLLKAEVYTPKVDIFALGCIMAELYLLGPLFAGENEIDQLNKIIAILGTPPQEWAFAHKQAKSLGIKFAQCEKVHLRTILGSASTQGIDLIDKMLTYDPLKRLSASEALKHPYFTLSVKTSSNAESMSSNPLATKHNYSQMLQDTLPDDNSSVGGSRSGGASKYKMSKLPIAKLGYQESSLSVSKRSGLGGGSLPYQSTITHNRLENSGRTTLEDFEDSDDGTITIKDAYRPKPMLKQNHQSKPLPSMNHKSKDFDDGFDDFDLADVDYVPFKPKPAGFAPLSTMESKKGDFELRQKSKEDFMVNTSKHSGRPLHQTGKSALGLLDDLDEILEDKARVRKPVPGGGVSQKLGSLPPKGQESAQFKKQTTFGDGMEDDWDSLDDHNNTQRNKVQGGTFGNRGFLF